MSWQEEITTIITNGCSDSDIEDFITTHPHVDGRAVWDYVYEQDAPADCKITNNHSHTEAFASCVLDHGDDTENR